LVAVAKATAAKVQATESPFGLAMVGAALSRATGLWFLFLPKASSA
jgi:hypothetical protein